MAHRPLTTLFMLTSVDGKISTGSGDERDFDRDLPHVEGVREGLAQYYALEQATDEHSLNSGRVMAKVGWNEQKEAIERLPIGFVIVDSRPHLTALGVENLARRARSLLVVTTNDDHPATGCAEPNVRVMRSTAPLRFAEVFARLRAEAGVERLTVQSGGELNAQLIRDRLVDRLSLVVAPVIVGGRATPTLVDGPSLGSQAELSLLQPLRLVRSTVLDESYLHLEYDVVAS